MRRFAGTGLALVLVVAMAAWWAWPVPSTSVERGRLLSFEPTALVRVDVVRGTDRFAVERTEAGWTVMGASWRPSQRIIRRVGHQLHALEARAVVGAPNADFGLGADAPLVTLTEQDGTTHQVRVGVANPTGVSHYVQILPDDTVFLVQRAAAEIFWWEWTAFREDEITRVDHDEVVRFEVELSNQRIDVVRDADGWILVDASPAVDVASDALALLLGRITGIRVRQVLADEPASLDGWDLGRDQIRVWGAGGLSFALQLARSPDGCVVYHEADRAVYAVGCGPYEWLDQLRGAAITGQ